MITRRTALSQLAKATLTGLASAPLALHAKLSCGPMMANGVQVCEAGIDSSLAHVTAAAVNGQHQTQWCWAASIEMVFRYYGYRVPQEKIVADTWGNIVNLPGQPGQILANLNRVWIDAQGRRFRAGGDSYSANPITAAQDLANDMPLIIGTMGHAMVLTSLTYLRAMNGAGEVKAAVVRDPWPDKGRRVLSAQEWYGTSFLARIRIQRM